VVGGVVGLLALLALIALLVMRHRRKQPRYSYAPASSSDPFAGGVGSYSGETSEYNNDGLPGEVYAGQLSLGYGRPDSAYSNSPGPYYSNTPSQYTPSPFAGQAGFQSGQSLSRPYGPSARSAVFR
jgi:hypothetical protein